MRQYGLIGYPLSHSFSQKYFTEKFLAENISDAEFLNFSLPAIQEFETVFIEHPQLQGLSVTIPYKKEIIARLDETDAVVNTIAACNCISIKNKKKKGFNTDVIGFEKSFTKYLKPEHTKALILGTGGAAAAVQYVLNKLNIPYLNVSRKAADNFIMYADVTSTMLEQYKIIINCTPLGTFPNIAEAPLLPYNLLNSSHYLFDLVYNPPLTKFLQHGKAQHCIIQNGYEMLTIQAEENWKIWNS